MQVQEIPAQRKFVGLVCHTLKTSRNRKYERGYLENYQR